MRASRTLDILLISSLNENYILYTYNYEGVHYRLFDCKKEVRKFFNCEYALFLEFLDDDSLDNYLLNYKIHKSYLLGISDSKFVQETWFNSNASENTNFIFKINGLNKSYIDEVNAIATATKLKDRLHRIEELGGTFEYIGAERDIMDFNLKMVDIEMPKIIGQILLLFYKQRISSLAEITDKLVSELPLSDTKDDDRRMLLTTKIKKLLVDILLGFFAGTKWNGSYDANGTIVLKSNGDCVGFHVIELDNLKNYLFENIKLDTPSTTRHRFGKLYLEKDGELYFKLNLQLRF